MEPLPHVGVVPVPQASPTGHARAETQLLGLVLPLDPGVQDVEDSAQHLPVR